MAAVVSYISDAITNGAKQIEANAAALIKSPYIGLCDIGYTSHI